MRSFWLGSLHPLCLTDLNRAVYFSHHIADVLIHETTQSEAKG